MSKLIRLTLVTVILLAGLPALPAAAQPSPSTCDPDKQQSSGAWYRICMPALRPWNQELVVYAHGYVDPNRPVGIPEDQLRLPDGTYIPELVNSLGFAFAMTSYSTNGLAVTQGISDTVDLVTNIFKATYGQPRRVYLVGASEGGLITALAVERYPGTFSGGLALCGPVGDFRKQINYWGDFRVVFDYFFPGALPRWTQANIFIPPQVMANWMPTLTFQIANTVLANPGKTEQFLRVTGAPTDPADSTTITQTVLGLLWYNVFATKDGVTKLGGNPFDNQHRWYLGSSNDWKLNTNVARFRASPTALSNIANNYQTSGRLEKPLITLHTTSDPIVPYWHVPLYRLKVLSKGSALLYSNIPIIRYGHCNFEPEEVLVGFALLVLKVTGQELINAHQALPNAQARETFTRLAKEHGALR